MPKEVVIEVDIAKVLNGLVKPTIFVWPGPHKLSISLDIDKDVYEVFDKDPLAYAKVRDPISDRYKAFLAAAETIYRACDVAARKAIGNPKELAKIKSSFIKGMNAELKALNGDVPTIADTEWKKFKKTKKEYAKYQIRSFIKVLLNIVGVVISALGLGGAVATGGLTALIGLHGMAKSLKGLYGEVSSLIDTAEDVRKSLGDDIKKLKKSYAKKSATMKGVVEVGKVAVEKILGKEFTTIEGCRKNLDTFGSKIDGIDVKSHTLAEKLQAILKATDAAAKQAKEVVEANPALKKPIEQLEQEINGLIVKIIAKQEQVKDGRKWKNETKGEIDLIAAGKPGWAKALETGLIFYDVVMSAKDFDKSITAIIDLTNNISSTAMELEKEFQKL